MVMKFVAILAVLLYVSTSTVSSVAASNSLQLSPDAEISLLTCSPGKEIYSLFGHSAVRVNDPVLDLDIVFNYGTFDFDTPHFHLKFMQGQLLYKLTVSTMEQFVQEYYHAGRAVYEQVLNLNMEETQRLFDFMMINRLPENAYYLYDFFFDNCATRIRDLADSLLYVVWADDRAISPEIIDPIRSKLDYSFYYTPDSNYNRSFRDLLHPFLENVPWLRFGIDLLLGMPSDRVAHPFEFMYLPDEMLIAFARASLKNGNPLVSEHRIILSKRAAQDPPGIFTPRVVFWAIFVLAIISLAIPKISRIFDLAFFNVLGIAGIIIFFLWFLSDHGATKNNLNILWALPTHLYFIWRAKYNDNRMFIKIYFRSVFIIALILLVSWPIIPQGLHPAFFPIILTVLIKSAVYAFRIPYITDKLTTA